MTAGGRISQAARRRLRAAGKIRTKFADASYTEIGQYALVMAGAAFLLLLVNMVALAMLLIR
ncbi:hypothetical protein [Amycolatopsis dendrobii]|uniref:Uncharacterized protein n=1 Tax=Amycolatopsis dendrobii TaxID=2760662 RepID=A0A7W3VUI1_9PSEU|nr:hypothetical protein [Amycolatopsis dendrobii]MBB1153456.1 hypothetical protein [Amycolatopsis dendrobii]